MILKVEAGEEGLTADGTGVVPLPLVFKQVAGEAGLPVEALPTDVAHMLHDCVVYDHVALQVYSRAEAFLTLCAREGARLDVRPRMARQVACHCKCLGTLFALEALKHKKKI